MARRVYSGGKQYSNKAKLQQCVLDEWQKIELDLLKSVARSIPSRCVDVLETFWGGKQNTKRTFTVADLNWPYLLEQVIIINLHGRLAVQIFE